MPITTDNLITRIKPYVMNWIQAGGTVGPFAPANCHFVTTQAESSLSAESVLTAGALITIATATVGLSVGTSQYQYPVTGANPYTPAWSTGFLDITAAKTLTVSDNTTITGGGTLALATYTLTVPASITAVGGGGAGANTRLPYWTDANTLSSSANLRYDSALCYLYNIGDDTSGVYFLDTYDDTGNSQQIYRRAGGTLAAPTAVLSGWILGTLGFRGYHSGGAFSTSSRAGMFAYAGEDWTATAQGTYIRFSTTTIGSTTTSVKLHIGNNGNIGFGGIVTFGTSAEKVLGLANATAPSTAITGTQVWSSTDGLNIMYTATKAWVIGDKFGAFGVAAVVRAAAYTQTYATANRTHANITAVDPGAYATGAFGYVSDAMAAAVHAEAIALRADIENIKQVLNSLIDDSQGYGLVQ